LDNMLQRLNGLLMQAGIVITETQKTQLVQLVELLHKWNKAYNLTSVRDRINFIRQVILELGLTNVTPVKSRVEEYQPETGFDGVLSRAFASLEDMLSWCHHLPSPEGSFLALKGQYPEQELAQLPDSIRLVATHKLVVPELEGERHLLEFKAIQPE